MAVSARKIIALDQTGFTGSGLICNNFVFFVLFVVKGKTDGHRELKISPLSGT